MTLIPPQISTASACPFNVNSTRLHLCVVCVSSRFGPDSLPQHPSFTPSEFCFNGWNQPFAPGDRRTAEDMIREDQHEYHDKEVGLDKIRKTLLHSWRQVDQETRR